eukprot:EC790747.1.p2 GENE.EC790747.1~~EC790747.1.p2  ORF type:complete len:170 (+),score=49.95 EC790747.1:35-544(+)
MASTTLKVVIAGPQGSGKSLITNVLAETIKDPADCPYIPTAGVRIFEVERFIQGRQVHVELWDASGDRKFESTLPAVLADMNSALLVFNPEVRAHEAEIKSWYDTVVVNSGLKSDQCLILSNRPHSGALHGPVKLPREMMRLKAQDINLHPGNLDDCHRLFEEFLESLI